MLIQPRLKHFFSEEERELAEVILKFEACGFPLSMCNVVKLKPSAIKKSNNNIVLTFVNACWGFCPPIVIHKGTDVNQSSLTNRQGARVAATTNGYITKSKFHEYAIRFVLFLKRNGLMDRTHLLIIDSHKSHVYNYTFLQYMLSNNMQVMTIPDHCSHIVQPLDNVPFAKPCHPFPQRQKQFP